MKRPSEPGSPGGGGATLSKLACASVTPTVQCPAVRTTSGAMSVPEQKKLPNSSSIARIPTFGCALPSSSPATIAEPLDGRTHNAATAASTAVTVLRTCETPNRVAQP